MLWLVAGLMQQYGYVRVYIDGANPSFIKSLKRMIGEDENYERHSKEQMERNARNMYSRRCILLILPPNIKKCLGTQSSCLKEDVLQ